MVYDGRLTAIAPSVLSRNFAGTLWPLRQDCGFAALALGARTRKLLEIVGFGQQVGSHSPQALGQTKIIAILGQTGANARLTPKIHSEEHGRSP
jgi:hypothetical protein